jgi:hypothetical protein
VALSGATGADTNKTFVTTAVVASGATILAMPRVDETVFINPAAGPVAYLRLTLPSPADCRVGQVKTVISSQDITVMDVGGDYVNAMGNWSLACYAGEAKAYQCIAIDPPEAAPERYATWLRIG